MYKTIFRKESERRIINLQSNKEDTYDNRKGRAKRAIKFLKQRIDVCIENANICDENDFDEEASQLREEQKHIKTVLNLIQQLQEEKEKYKELYNKALSDLAIDDKVINEMAKYIRVDDIEEFDDIDLCDFLGKSYDDCRHLSSACEDCIKQYFKKKAEKEKC